MSFAKTYQLLEFAAMVAAKRSREHIDPEERERFQDTAERELLGLHEGNFARYQRWCAAGALPETPNDPTVEVAGNQWGQSYSIFLIGMT